MRENYDLNMLKFCTVHDKRIEKAWHGGISVFRACMFSRTKRMHVSSFNVSKLTFKNRIYDRLAK